MKSGNIIFKIIQRVPFLWVMLIGFASCDGMDATYREYIKDGEIVYTGKADSLRAFPGHNRVKLAWLATTDPKVKTAAISWNDGAESKEHIISRAPGIRWEEAIIDNLAEGSYTFEVVTYDDKGNKSVRMSTQGTAYGDLYIASIQPRRVRNSATYTTDGQTHIDWHRAPEGLIRTELEYTDTYGNTRAINVLSTDTRTDLPEYQIDTEIRYRTVAVPDTLSIDVFSADYVTMFPTFEFLRNTGSTVSGFVSVETSGTYRTLADWTVNAAARNAGGGTSGDWELVGSVGMLSLQGGIVARPVMTNGKIYQTTTLPEGKYRFWVEGLNLSNNSINTRHQVVAVGETIPNRENLATQALAYNSIANPADVVLEFELTATTRVSIGFVVSFTGGHWLKVSKVNLDKIE